MAAGLTHREAAQALGVKESTLGRWLQDSAFQAELRRQTDWGLQAAYARAMARVAETLADKNPMAVLKAAQILAGRLDLLAEADPTVRVILDQGLIPPGAAWRPEAPAPV